MADTSVRDWRRDETLRNRALALLANCSANEIPIGILVSFSRLCYLR